MDVQKDVRKDLNTDVWKDLLKNVRQEGRQRSSHVSPLTVTSYPTAVSRTADVHYKDVHETTAF